MSEPKTPHRFVLLGSEHVTPLLTAVQLSDDHQFVGLALADLRRDLPGQLRCYEDWESLADDDEVDAVIVNDTRPEVLEFARRLISRGKPLIVPAGLLIPPEFVAELSLFDAEGASVLVPFFDRRNEVALLRRLIDDGRLGSIISIQLDRTDVDVDRSAGSPAWYSGVRFEDVDWLRTLGGDYSQVTLIRSGGEDRDTFVTQTLQLAGPGLPDATCTYRRSHSVQQFQIRVDGTRESAEFHFEGTGDRREAVVSVDGTEIFRESIRADPKAVLDGIDRSWRKEPGGAEWSDLVRVHEINEAMQRSLRRRRTIELHFEIASERSQFKTQMATVGCFVLVYTLFAWIGMLIAGAVLDPRDDLQRTSEGAEFILRRDEFDVSAERLTPLGEQHLQEIARRWQASAAAVLIVESASQSDAPGQRSFADEERLSVVRQRLADLGIPRIDERTVVRPLASEHFRTLLRVGRVIAIAPLGVFLLMQLLLVISRPARVTSHAAAARATAGSPSSRRRN